MNRPRNILKLIILDKSARWRLSAKGKYIVCSINNFVFVSIVAYNLSKEKGKTWIGILKTG